MEDRRIEAALRAGRPDEPTYRGETAELLHSRVTSPGQGPQAGRAVDLAVEVVAPPLHQRSRWLALASAAAAVVLVIGLATIARRDSPPAATTPTSTLETPTSSITPGRLPAELIDRWVGATPSSLSTPNPSAPAFVVFNSDRVTLEHLSGGIVNDFTSDVTVAGAGELVLTLTGQIGRCDAGATGRYAWTVSPHATTLTLEAIDDKCPDRAVALAGRWTHTACPTPSSDCLGTLEAGTYASVNFDPFDSGSYGQVAYTVPDGWTSTLDDKGRLTLLPSDNDGTDVHGVYLFADVAATTTDCPASARATADMSAIADAITSTPGLVSTTSVTSVGGYEARAIDISAAEPICDGAQPLLTSKSRAPTSWTTSIGDGQQMRIILVDLADDRTMAIVIASDGSASAFATLLDESSVVIDSLLFSDTP